MKYLFYDFLEVAIHSEKTRYIKYFKNEYSKISSKRTKKEVPRIDVHIVSKLPKAAPSDIIRKLKVKNLFTFHYLIKDIDSTNPIIYFKSHPIDRLYIKAVAVFLQAQILEPVMYYTLLKNNVLFMHSAGVSNGNSGYAFPAHGGTGKTTLSLSLSRAGYKFMGDDLLLVDTYSAKVYPYLRPLHIFTYNVNTLRDANIPFKYRFAVKFKNIIRTVLESLFKSEFLISTRIHINEIYSDIEFSTPVKLKKIIFLKKSGEDGTIKVNSKDKAAILLIHSFDLNKSFMDNIALDQELANKFTRIELKVVKKLLSNFEVIYSVNTRKIDIYNPESVISLLEK